MYGLLDIRRRTAALFISLVSAASASWAIDPPVLTSPASAATNQPIPLALMWAADSAATGYRVQVSALATFASSMITDTIVGAQPGESSVSLLVSGMSHKTRYYWRVHSRQGNDSSTWSAVRYFTTIVDTPAVPVLSTPLDGAQSQGVNPTSLAWGAAQDASTYRLQVATDIGFSSLVYSDSAITTTSKQVSGLLNNTVYYWRVQARNVGGQSAFSVVRSFATKPAAPQVVSPATNATSIPVSPLLSWTQVPGAASYRVQLSTVTAFTTMMLNATTTSETLRVGPLANKVKYYWRVRAQNADGDTSAYPATPWNFTTIVIDAGVPALLAPADSAKSQPVSPTTLSWSAVTDAATYRLQVATDPGFSSVVYDDSTITTTSRQVSGLQTGSRYFWRVRAKNVATIGTFSATRTFTTRLTPPTAIAPTSGALDQFIQPVLRWSQVATASAYYVQVSKSSQFRGLAAEATVSAESLQVGPLGNDSVYYWRVSARNANGDTSVFPTTAWSFRTKIPTPSLNIPGDGATGQPVNPVLSWFASPGASSYRLQVSDDPTFPSSVVFDDAGITATSRQVGPLNSSKVYYWRLNARNSAGTSTSLWSEIRSFATRIDTPITPTLASPANGSIDLDFNPVLQWNQSSGAAFYALQIARDSLFTQLEFERSPLVATSFQAGPLASNTTFFWRVLATNSTGTASSAYSAAWSFKTMLQTPEVPVLVSPPSRSLAQSVNPTLRWSSFASSESYHLQISTDSYFPTTVLDTTGVRDTVLLLGRNLAHNTAYYWRVKGLNRLDSSAYSLPFNFTTVIADPVLLTPAQGASDYAPQQVTFTWSPVPGARTYGFRLALDSTFQSVVHARPSVVPTSVVVESLSVSTRYYWQVTAQSDSNGTTASPVRQFTTVVTVPGIPQLVAPAPSASNLPTTVTFQWQPAIGANSYRLQISTDSLFGTVLYDFPSLTSTSHQVASLAYNTAYFWRVNASNGNGPSEYSPARGFTVAVPPPAVPFLTGPADGQTNVGLPVTLTWGAASGATSYRVRISSTENFSTVVYDSTTAVAWKSVGSIAYGSRFYWQVTATNPGGAQSSAIWSFSTRISIPTVPLPALPQHGSINVPTTVTLNWSGSVGAVSYHIQVARDSLFTVLLANDSTVTATSFGIGPLDGYTQFYWRIRAQNAGGSSAFSPVWAFRTVVGTPSLLAPAASAMRQPPVSTLRWSGVGSVAAFRVQISTSPDFGLVIVDTTGLADTVFQTAQLSGFTRYYWRVSARSLDGLSTGEFAQARYFTTILDRPELVAPLPDVLNQPVMVAVRWHRTEHAESYRLDIARDEAFTSFAAQDSMVLDTMKVVGPLDGLTQYWWRVRSQNPADVSEYSQTRSFRTTIGTPQLVSPADGEPFAPESPALLWTEVPGAARYRVQVATDSLFSQVVVDDSLISGTTRTVGPLMRLQRYYWRVRAKSADGLSIGVYSTARDFRIVPAPPLATSLVAPPDGAINQPLTSALRWRRSAGADCYGVQVAEDSLFAVIVADDSTIADTTYRPSSLEGLRRYFWRVRCLNPGGSSAYTSRWNFSTVIGTPVPIAPVQDTTDQPVTARIVWSSVPRAATYRLQLSVDSLFRSFAFDDSMLVEASRTIAGLLRSTRYYWRVRARSTGGTSTSPWCATQRFITVIDPPATPVLALPLQGAKNVPVAPVLAWQNAARAARYRVQLAADSLFEFIVFEDTTVADTSRQMDSLDHFAIYHWRVQAVNTGGTSSWSARRMFLTSLATPQVVSPEPNAVDQKITTTIQWSPVKGAGRYRLVVSPDSMLRTPVLDDTSITTTSRLVSGLTYLTNYYYRVLAKTADGSSYSAPSPIRRFTTVVEPPPAPLLTVPLNHAEGEDAARALVWSSAVRAQRYHVQVSAESLFVQPVVNDSSVTDTVYSPGALQAHTRHWWRVRAGNTGGWSSFSPLWSYTTSLATPTQLVPEDSATGLGDVVTFRWTPSPEAVTYALELARDRLFRDIIFRDSTISGTSRDVPGLEPFLTYYWRVRALDIKGAGAYSSTRLFITRLVPPIAPLQEAPASGQGSLLTSQTFRWHPSRLADRYQIQIATDSPFDSTVYDQSGIVDTAISVSTLAFRKRYYWRVRGWNAEGAGAFSTVWSFSTVVAPPQTPVPVSPASASSGQMPYTTFAWGSTPHAQTYHLQVSLDAPFASMIYNDSTLTDTLQKVGPLEYTRTYYWRVRAQNEDWTTSWSPVWSSTVMAAPVVYDLYQNFPNPANPSTVIRYDIPAEAEVVLTLYNLLGQSVRELVNTTQKAGRYEYVLEGADLPSGVYFFRISAKSLGLANGQPALPSDPFVSTRKMVILK